MKDPYIFDFIPFKTDMLEREIEEALVKDVTKLLLELGTGFAFLGNQYHLNVGGDDFYIDLLFYNLNLRCYVVIELKTGEFKPEYAGQLNFYLSAVDGILKKEQDNPTVGLLLCKSKNDLVAEYSLKDMSKPIGVSAYQVTSKLPEESVRSKDPSSQVGACIVSPENKILSLGYNGMPIGCDDDAMPWEREGEPLNTKYMYVCHAELNAILNSAHNNLKGARVYVTLFPCNECTKAIIQSGIAEVVYYSDKYHDTDSSVAARFMFKKAGVRLTPYQPSGRKAELEL